jgi:hypothetical protein
MEYVEGVSILRFCQERGLLLRERLELFLKVCAAVEFAHRNLVVHRDLKPDNILVLPDGTPRLLDFGTAKLLAAHTASEFTQLGLQAFTPAFASPEQVLGEAISTASDTYSLGVLLYLLLTGAPPYELKEGTTAELLRVVCETPPPRPGAVAPGLDADLDAIVLRALRKEPQERYRSVDAFADDLRAYLEGRPVLARRGSRRYRAAKFIRRNKLALGAAALLCASLVAGLAGVLWQFRKATRERRVAEARSEDLRLLAGSLLSEIDEAVKQLPGSTPARRLLVQRVLEHLDRMARDRARDRLTQLDLVEAYTRLGNLQGNPYDQNIGDPEGALASLAKALAIAGPLGGDARAPRGGDARALGALARAEQSRSEVLFGVGRTGEAIEGMQRAIAAFERRAALPGATADDLCEAGSAHGGLGDQRGQSGVASLGDPRGAVEAFRRNLDFAARALALNPDHLRAKRAVAVCTFKIGNIVSELDPAAAVQEYHRSLAGWEALPPSTRTGTGALRAIAMTQRKLGRACTEAFDVKAAQAAFRQARGTYQDLADADPKDTRAQYDLEVQLSNEALLDLDLLDPRLNPQGPDRREHLQRAQDLLRRCLDLLQRLVAVNPGNESWVLTLAYVKVQLGTLGQEGPDPAAAARLTAAGLDTLRKMALAPEAGLPTLDCAAAALLQARPERLRDPALAMQLTERLVARTQGRKPAFVLERAQACNAAGQTALGRAAAREGLALLPEGSRSRTRKLLELEAR